MTLPEVTPIPDAFIRECAFHYDQPMTYYRVEHLPTGATAEMKYDQFHSQIMARSEVLQLCYNLYHEYFVRDLIEFGKNRVRMVPVFHG